MLGRRCGARRVLLSALDAWNSNPADVDHEHDRLWDWSDNQIVRAWHAGASPQNFTLFTRDAFRVAAALIVRILYFADIRFPLERANGIQTMETCYALAERGHDVRLVVKPDTHSPPRDPFEFYGLPKVASLVIERANTPPGAGILQRVGYMSFVFGRAFGKARADVILTRDLGVAAALVRMPASMRAPVVYESHGYAPDVAAALPALSRLRSLRALPSCSGSPPARSWCGDTRTATSRSRRVSPTSSSERFGRARTCRGRARRRAHCPIEIRARCRGTRRRLRRPSLCLERSGRSAARAGSVSGARGLIIGGHEEEPDLGRARSLATELGSRTG